MERRDREELVELDAAALEAAAGGDTGGAMGTGTNRDGTMITSGG